MAVAARCVRATRGLTLPYGSGVSTTCPAADMHCACVCYQVALLKKQYEEKHKAIEDTVKASLKDKYGGDGLTKPVPKELLFGETEAFVEYSRDGRVLRGAVRDAMLARPSFTPCGFRMLWWWWFCCCPHVN